MKEMENIRFLVLHSNTYVKPRCNEHDELVYYLGALRYDTIVWLLDGETPVKAYKALTSDNIYCKIYKHNGVFVVESADIQELPGFDCLLQLRVGDKLKDVVAAYTLPFVLSEVVGLRKGDSVAVLLNEQEVYQFASKQNCTVDLRFDCFEQESEGRYLMKLKIFEEDLEVKEAVIFVK